MMPIKGKYERLLARRAPLEDRQLYNFSEAFQSQQGEATKYIIGAMAPMAQRYTQRLIEQGNRVENQLKTRLTAEYPALAFRRQGSVSNNTHIKFHSDVDVLTIIDKFETLEPPQLPAIPYTGDTSNDMLTLRNRVATELENAFPKAKVDNTGATCVSIEGGSLLCSVDAVPANWFNTVAWNTSKEERDRAIQVYNRESKQRTKNFPFLFNYRIDQHDSAWSGVARALIRLLKSIKGDHEQSGPDVEIDFSSFDICSLVYRMPIEFLNGFRWEPLKLVHGLLKWMATVLNDAQLRQTLLVVDDSRLIFNSASKEQGLRVLFDDLLEIYQQAEKECQGRSLITEAHL